VENVEERSSNT